MMARILLLSILGAASLQLITAIDTVVWNLPTISTKLDVKELVREASPSSPLLIALTDKFSLAEFSKLANVYAGNENSKIPGIFKSIAGSENYGAEWSEDDILAVLKETGFKGVLKYQNQDDDTSVGTASIILIQGTDLPSIDDSVAHVVSLIKGKGYKAVLSGKEDASQHKIVKRELQKKADEPVDDDSNDLAAASGPYVARTNCTVYLAGANIQYYSTKANAFQKTNMTTQSLDCAVTGKVAKITANLAGTGGGQNTVVILVVNQYNDMSWTVSSINIPQSGLSGYTGNYSVTTLKWLNQIYSITSFNYACGQTPFYWSGSPTAGANADKAKAIGISFTQLQIQPFYPSGNFTNNVDDCVPFFSPGTWMSLLTIFLLLLILLFGLVMVTSLKTMDRFDDPKGRPLQINVRE